MAEEQKQRLGRGLAALLGENSDSKLREEGSSQGHRVVPIEWLRPNTRNPRKSFPEELLAELAASIRERGVLQPIIVRPLPDSPHLEIVAGERRWRAAQKAEIHEVPVVRIEADDKQALEIAIVENVQRTDLNALEEAEGYQRLLKEFEYTQSDLGKVIGKSRSHIANTIRLTKLPSRTRTLLAEGRISAGHARALLALPDPDSVAESIVKKGLTVRDVELLSEAPAKAKGKSVVEQAEKPAETRALEKQLTDELGMSVALNDRGGRGELRIRYETLEQLELICSRLRCSA